MPSIDLIVNELIVRDRNIGRLEVDAHNFDEDGVPVWQLDKLDITNPDATLTATANWRTSTGLGTQRRRRATPRRTVFDFKLDIKDAGALLERFGLPRTLKAGSGSLSGKVVWHGGPTAIDYPTLNGNLAVDLRHGADPQGRSGRRPSCSACSACKASRASLTLNFQRRDRRGPAVRHVTGTAHDSERHRPHRRTSDGDRAGARRD